MRIYYNFVVPFNIKRASKIITVSNSAKEEIQNYFPSSIGKIEVIYHGLDPIYKQNKMLKKKNQILYVGSLNKRKNFVNVIKMFNMLNTDTTLKIVGNFSSNFDLDKQTQELIEKAKSDKNIIFVQNITTTELIQTYNESKLFLYPSFYEGFGLPILEAMGCGTPVLCSNTTSMPEVGGDAAIYVQPDEVEDMLHKTKKILSDELLQKDMIEKGLLQSQKFTLDKMTKKHLDIFKRLVDEK